MIAWWMDVIGAGLSAFPINLTGVAVYLKLELSTKKGRLRRFAEFDQLT